MATKKKQSKSRVIKRTPPQVEVTVKKSEGPSEGAIVCMVLAGAALFIYLMVNGFSLPGFLKSEQEIRVGQCYVDRSYQFVKVKHNYNALETSTLQEMRIREFSDNNGYEYAWYLTEKDGYTLRDRTHDFIRKNYSLVSCLNLYTRD